jgi:hypothetical protein
VWARQERSLVELEIKLQEISWTKIAEQTLNFYKLVVRKKNRGQDLRVRAGID